MTEAGDPRPAPPWDAVIDLRTFDRMDIPTGLFRSPAFAALSDAGFRAAVRLVDAAWREVPAGSLPMDLAALTDWAGYGRDSAAWQAIADEVLGQWVQCHDDRFYLAELAACIEDAWARKTRKSAGAARRTQRTRFRRALADVGVINVASLTNPQIDAAIDHAEARGVAGMRGRARADLITSVASDHGLLPENLGSDIRLTSAFRAPLTAIQSNGK